MSASSAASSGLDRFAALLAEPQPRLLACALSLAQDRYPRLSPDQWLHDFDDLGERLTRRVPSDASPLHRLRLLNHFFFEELGFHGNEDDYYDPDNSCLNRVLERRTGLPIALAVLYIELGRALGLRMGGLSFPSHFLVRLSLNAGDMIIDVFGRGRTLSLDDLRERLASLGVRTRPVQSYLREASTRDIVTRMLRNLKASHLRRKDWASLLAVQHRLVLLLPDAAEERRDRGLTYLQLECPRAAAEDFAVYLSARDGLPDEAEIRARLAAARAAASHLN